MAMANILGRISLFTWALGRKMSSKEKESILGLMGVFTREIGTRIKCMEKVK